MTEDYEIALELFQLNRSHTVTDTLARHIVHIAQTGEQDPRRIASQAIKELKQ